MRNPDLIGVGERTVFMAEGFRHITINERILFNFPEIEEGKDVIITENPAFKDYRQTTSPLTRVKDEFKGSKPVEKIVLAVDRSEVDFDKKSKVVFTVTPIEGSERCYNVVSHTVSEGQVKQPPTYSSFITELLSAVARKIFT